MLKLDDGYMGVCYSNLSTFAYVSNFLFLKKVKKNRLRDFLGGAMVKNTPAKAGDTGLIPGPGRSHMLRSK